MNHERIHGMIIEEHEPPYMCPVCGKEMRANGGIVECVDDEIAYLVMKNHASAPTSEKTPEDNTKSGNE